MPQGGLKFIVGEDGLKFVVGEDSPKISSRQVKFNLWWESNVQRPLLLTWINFRQSLDK